MSIEEDIYERSMEDLNTPVLPFYGTGSTPYSTTNFNSFERLDNSEFSYIDCPSRGDLAESINNELNIRKKIYENPELFYKDNLIPTEDANENSKEDSKEDPKNIIRDAMAEIKENVKKMIKLSEQLDKERAELVNLKNDKEKFNKNMENIKTLIKLYKVDFEDLDKLNKDFDESSSKKIDERNNKVIEIEKQFSLVQAEVSSFTSILSIRREFTGECPICYNNQVNYILPCGHPICGDCEKMVKQTKKECYTCRQPYKKAIKMYV